MPVLGETKAIINKRTIFLIAVLTLAVLSVCGWLYYKAVENNTNQLIQTSAEQTLANISGIVPYLIEYYELNMLKQLEESHESSPGINYLIVLNSEDRPILGHRRDDGLQEIRYNSDSKIYRIEVGLVSGNTATIEMGMNPDIYHEDLHLTRWGVLFLVCLGTVMITTAGYWIMRLRLSALIQTNALELEREAKRLAETMARTKSEFLANMSHEIRTPLNGILGIVDLLGRTKLQAGQQELLDDLSISSRNIVRLFNQILDASQIDSGKMVIQSEEFAVGQILETLETTFGPKAREKGLDLEIFRGSAIPDRLVGDSLRLQQVLNNLVGNALKFSDSGQVCVRMDLVKQTPGAATLGFTVEDQGQGIPPEAMDSLFEPFTQAESSAARRHQGAGLGLSICRDIIRQMGGDITGENRPSGGARFRCQVTLSKALVKGPEAAEMSHAQSEKPKAGAGLAALVVEDNPINQRILCLSLKALKMDPVVANNGLEALEKFDDQTFDIIFMDCQMPEMDGYEATQEIRQKERLKGLNHTPIVATTANNLPGDREKCLNVGMDDFLAKPYTRQDLEKTADRWIVLEGALA